MKQCKIFVKNDDEEREMKDRLIKRFHVSDLHTILIDGEEKERYICFKIVDSIFRAMCIDMWLEVVETEITLKKCEDV